MTTEEAVKMTEARLKCLINDTSGTAEECLHGCDNCALHYEQGNLGEQKEWLTMAIKALKQDTTRKRAKWIEDGYYKLPCVCSYCGNEGKYNMKYCPNCGAEMEE